MSFGITPVRHIGDDGLLSVLERLDLTLPNVIQLSGMPVTAADVKRIFEADAALSHVRR